MKVAIVGGTGFVGRGLCERFVAEGHDVLVIARSAHPKTELPREAEYVSADATVKGSWQERLRDRHAVFNVAGVSIFRRWTKKAKRLLYDSRVIATRNIVDALPEGKNTLLCNASAVGYYGFHDDETLTEEDARGEDFLASMCADWEHEALKAQEKGGRTVLCRFGIVLERGGGALKQMAPIFSFGLGGALGTGRQWFSWIHMEDLLNALVFVLTHNRMQGVFNMCSPNPVRNKEFTRALGRVIHRPTFLPAPGFMVRLVLGEFGSVLLEGQRVLPQRLLDSGFIFRYPQIEEALREAFASS